MSNVVTETKVRLSFCNLLVPRAQDSQKPDDKTYSSAVLIPKSDTATVEAIKAAINEALEDGVVKTWGGNRPAQLRNPLRDGDEKYLKDGVTKDPTYAGMWFINAKGPYGGKSQPVLLGPNGQQTDSAAVIYSGVFGQVKLNFFAYDKAGNRGIGAGIASFLSSGQGDALSSVETADSARADFGVADTSPASEFATGNAATAAAEGASTSASAPAEAAKDVWT